MSAKEIPGQIETVKTEYFAGTKMPLNNGNPDLDYGNTNAFRARPLKLPRRQYGNARTETTTGVTRPRNLMFLQNAPASSFVTANTNTLCDNVDPSIDNTGPQCCNPEVVPNESIRGKRADECSDPCKSSTNCYSVQKNARQRVRGGALLKNPVREETVNGQTTLVRRNYFSNSSSYLKNRVLRESAPNVVVTNDCVAKDVNDYNPKATNITNPSNKRFYTQGAVSSSTRLSDIKTQTLSAYNFDQRGLGNGAQCCSVKDVRTTGAIRRLGGTYDAPFDEKAKNYVPILGQRTLFKRVNGRKTVCCATDATP